MVFYHTLSSAVIVAGLLYLAVAAYGYALERKVEKHELSTNDVKVAKWVMAIIGVLLLLTLFALARERKSVSNVLALLVASILGAVLAFYIFSILNKNEPGATNKLVDIKNMLISSMVIAVIVIAIGLYHISAEKRSSGSLRRSSHRRSGSKRRASK